MDTTRQPPQGPPPNYGFVTKVYKRNLRPIVLTVTLISSIWALFSSISNFRSANVIHEENVEGASLLRILTIVTGAIFAVVTIVEAFGFFAALRQRLNLVRVYAYLSAATALLVFASGLIRVITHFTQKRTIIETCASRSEGGVLYYPWGWWGPASRDFLDRTDAVNWCTRLWSRDSASDVIYMLFTVFLSLFFLSLAFGYYRQLADPTSVTNMIRTPQNPHFAPSHYNPPYGASVPNLGYGNNGPYTGGPPPQGYQTQPYPGYGGFSAPPGPPPPAQKAPDHVGGDGTAGATYNARATDDPFADFEDTGRRPVDSNNRL